MTIVARLVREPLVHFLGLGGVIFGLYAASASPEPKAADTVIIGPDRVEQLRAGFESVWRRPPTGAETTRLVEEFVREEIYYREALALGLHDNDAVIRLRMRQKMEFLSDAGTDLTEPTDADLDAWLAAHPDDYRADAQIAFEQIYLGEEPTLAPEPILAKLRAVPGADPASFGTRTLLPMRLPLSQAQVVDAVFGQGFFDELRGLPVDAWAGPIASGYGLHLVRIVDALPGRTLTLNEVRDAVARDWRDARVAEARDDAFARIRKRYVVEIPAAVGAPEPGP